MKFFLLMFFAGIYFCSSAQEINPSKTKIGIFDVELMVKALPEYKVIDSLLLVYSIETIDAEHEIYQQEYQRLDSIIISHLNIQKFKNSKYVDSLNKQRLEIATSIVYWQSYQHSKDSTRRMQLAKPLYEKVTRAFYKVVEQNHYDYVFKPDAIVFSNNADNLFIAVAKELSVAELPEELKKIGRSKSDKD